MEEYVSNSHKSKEFAINNSNITPTDKKIESVVTGSTKTKKNSEFTKFVNTFIAEDVAKVKNYIFKDVLVPSIKKIVIDIVTNGIEILLNGESSSSKRTNASKVSYRSYYDKNDERSDPIRKRDAGAFDYDKIIFENRGDAEVVLNNMEDIIERYGVASVQDLYDLSDVQTNNYSVAKYGWTNLRFAEVVVGRDGYYLRLPRATVIQ